MNEAEKAYLAGIIDGEDSIMLSKYHKFEYPSPCISISSTDLELLEWIKVKVGSGRINKKRTIMSVNIKPLILIHYTTTRQ